MGHKILALILSFCFLTTGLQAQQLPTIEQSLQADLDLRLKLNSIILEVATQIDREHPELSLKSDSKVLENIMREKSMIFHDFYLQHFKELGPEQKSLFKKAWQAIQWQNLIAVLKKTTLEIQVMFKRRGFGMAIAVFMGFVSDYSIPFILTNIGLPWLIPLSAITPYQLLYSMLPQKVTELKIRFKMRQSLGGRAPYFAYLRQESITREALKAMHRDTILLPININPDTPNEALSVRKNSWFRSFMQQMGFRDNEYSLATVQRFLREQDISDDYLKQITEHPRLERWQKAAMIASHLQETMDGEQRLAFTKRFSQSFYHISAMKPWDGFEDWTKSLLKARSIAEINQILLQVPEGTPTRLILQVWQDVILPHYATKADVGYFSYRRLVEDFAATRALILSNEEALWDISSHQRLLNYLGKSMNDKGFIKCQNSAQKVLRFLVAP